MWKLIKKGYEFPTKVVDGIPSIKDLDEMNEVEELGFIENQKSVYMLVNSIDRNEYNKIRHCRTTKEIWRLLEITHEGTNQVKESKLSMYEQAYELFKMLPHESIADMYTRFMEIVNGMLAHGRQLSEHQKVTKILRSLPSSWNSKVDAILESRHEYSLEELIGSLMIYELRDKTQFEKKMLEDATSRMKGIALRVSSLDIGKEKASPKSRRRK